MLVLSLLLLLPWAIAAPAPDAALASLSSLSATDFSDLASNFHGCKASRLTVPVGSNLTLSPGEVTNLVTVGRGVQNYTCSGGAYVTAGALANLYDVACVFSKSSRYASTAQVSELLPKVAYRNLKFPDDLNLPVAVDHFFVDTPNAASGISPEFASQTDRVILQRDSAVNAPNPTVNVPWLKLTALSGEGTLASTVYRLNTVSGQPPASCSTEGGTISVQYAAMYWFTK